MSSKSGAVILTEGFLCFPLVFFTNGKRTAGEACQPWNTYLKQGLLKLVQNRTPPLAGRTPLRSYGGCPDARPYGWGQADAPVWASVYSCSLKEVGVRPPPQQVRFALTYLRSSLHLLCNQRQVNVHHVGVGGPGDYQIAEFAKKVIGIIISQMTLRV